MLKSRGYSYGAIGRALGRDPSYISQVARGLRSGAVLADALDAWTGGRRIIAPPVKVKGGYEQRGSPPTQGTTGPHPPSEIRQYRGSPAGGYDAVKRAAERGMTLYGKVELLGINVNGEPVRVWRRLWDKGTKAKSLIALLAKNDIYDGSSFHGWLYELLADMEEQEYITTFYDIGDVQFNFQ